LRLAVALIAALQLAACRTGRVPWSDEMAHWFNNASVNPPEPDPRDWARPEWESFLRRIGFADAAVIGTMSVVTTFSQLTTARQVSLVFRPLEVLHGSLAELTDEDGGIALVLEEGSLDFNAARAAARRVAGRRFLLFVKERPQRAARPLAGWEGSLWQQPAAQKSFQWALYRPAALLLLRVRTMYAWLARK
jgi:hypothetical protein